MPETLPNLPLRDVRDEDALDLVELVGSCFGEYPGCVLDVDGEMPMLRGLATYAAERGGAFWVVELPPAGLHPSRVVALGGFLPRSGGAGSPPGAIEVHKLYVHRAARRFGLGGQLLGRVEEEGRRRGAALVDLWSDTRFTTAHAFYERRGFTRGLTTRELHDKSDTVEHYFSKKLGPSKGPG
jgi:putative acetyltransferase